MSRLEAFLPPHLVEDLGRRDDPTPSSRSYRACLLLSDISGFHRADDPARVPGETGRRGGRTDRGRLYRAALAIAREIRDRRTEAVHLLGLGSMLRRRRAPPSTWRAMVEEAAAVFERAGDDAELCRALCELGQGALLEGRDPGSHLARARELRDRLGEAATARIRRQLEALEAAAAGGARRSRPASRRRGPRAPGSRGEVD